MQQDEPSDTPPVPLHNIVPAMICCALGLLFSVGSGLYVAISMQGISTYLAMQALIVYSFPYILSAVVGIFVCNARRIKLLTQIFTAGAVILLVTALTVTFNALDGVGSLAQQFDNANITAFNFELVIAVSLSAALMITARLTRA